MKIHKRNIATIILAILCTVALAFGVSFVMPKITKSANATTVSETPTISYGPLLYFGNSDYNKSVTEADMSTQVASYVSYSTSGNSISTAISAVSCSDYQINTIIASKIELSITVPAHTIYTIKYKNSHSISGKYGREHGIMDEWSTDSEAGFYFDCSTFGSGGRSGKINGDNDRGLNSGPHPSGHLVSLYNDTGNSKKLSVYTYYIHHIGDGGPSGVTYTTSFAFDSFTVTAAKIDAPSASGATATTYDGNNIQFGFTYDTPDVEDFDGYVTYTTAYKNIIASVYSAKDYDGNAINSSTYELGGIDINGIPTTKNGTLTATEAGVYTLKFNLTSDAIANGIEWSTGGTGEKTLTFTINRKAIPVPTVLNSTQTYKAGEYEFG
ncbi:MAG: hypothetical protein K2J83_07920, partial [Clostridia bacterium]|nr:hypothetical protein [Clostridia bacterium]